MRFVPIVLFVGFLLGMANNQLGGLFLAVFAILGFLLWCVGFLRSRYLELKSLKKYN